MFRNKAYDQFVFLTCSILLLLMWSCTDTSTSEKPSTLKANDSITFSGHIASIVFKNCTPCHRPGESGPFSLLTYTDARRNANKIKFAVGTRFMPPWPADAGYSHFIGERTLLEEEIALIKKWVEQGCLPGDTNQLPPLPSFYTGSSFGKPDLVVRLKDAVFLKGNGTDNFLMVKYPYAIPRDTFARIIEFVPHQRKLVHHVNGHLISYDETRRFNYFSGESVLPDVQSNFKTFFNKMRLGYEDGIKDFPPMVPNTVYYLPGYTPPVYPENIGGYVLKKNGVFLLKNVHYGPSNKDLYDSSYINVFYSKKPPIRPLRETQLGTFGIAPIEPALVVSANEIKTFHTQWTTPRDLSVLSVNPHMHLLGKNFLAYALTPQNDTIRLIKINRWDFRWQYYYTFKKIVKIPAGSTIHVYGTFDNTDKNPFNPFSPPRTISQGEGNESMQTTEEMFQFIFTYLPYEPGDENISLEGN